MFGYYPTEREGNAKHFAAQRPRYQRFDKFTAGTHTIEYTVIDEAGNTATATRTVHVEMPPVADPAPEPATESTPDPVPEPAIEPTTP